MVQVPWAAVGRVCAIAVAILIAFIGLNSCGGGDEGEAPARASSPGSGTGGSPGSGTGGNNTAVLAWDPPVAGTPNGYRVYFGTAQGVYFQKFGQGVDVGKDTTYTVTGLSSGTRYFFAATAYDILNNESAYSNEVFKDVP